VGGQALHLLTEQPGQPDRPLLPGPPGAGQPRLAPGARLPLLVAPGASQPQLVVPPRAGQSQLAVPPGPGRSLTVPSGLGRSLSIPAGPGKSLAVAAGLGQSLAVATGPSQSLPVAAGAVWRRPQRPGPPRDVRRGADAQVPERLPRGHPRGRQFINDYPESIAFVCRGKL